MFSVPTIVKAEHRTLMKLTPDVESCDDRSFRRPNFDPKDHRRLKSKKCSFCESEHIY